MGKPLFTLLELKEIGNPQAAQAIFVHTGYMIMKNPLNQEKVAVRLGADLHCPVLHSDRESARRDWKASYKEAGYSVVVEDKRTVTFMGLVTDGRVLVAPIQDGRIQDGKAKSITDQLNEKREQGSPSATAQLGDLRLKYAKKLGITVMLGRNELFQQEINRRDADQFVLT